MKDIRLQVFDKSFSVIRLAPGDKIPPWALEDQQFSSISRTRDELSLVVEADKVPQGTPYKVEGDWICLKVLGPLDFSLTGILYSLSKPLTERKISLFAISTFDTDYLLVKKASLTQAVQALRETGFTVTGTP